MNETKQIFNLLPAEVKQILPVDEMMRIIESVELAQMIVQNEVNSEIFNDSDISNGVSEEVSIFGYEIKDISAEVKVRALRRRCHYKKGNSFSRGISKSLKENRREEKISKKRAEIKSVKKQMAQLRAEYC